MAKKQADGRLWDVAMKTAISLLLLTGAALIAAAVDHESRLSVIEDREKIFRLQYTKDMEEIKFSLRRIEDWFHERATE